MRTSWPCRSALGRDRHYTRKFPSRPSAHLQRRAVDGGDSGAPLFRVGDDRVDVHAGQLAVAQLRLAGDPHVRSEEHTSELQSLMRISYAVFCLKKKKYKHKQTRLKSYRNTSSTI